MKNLILAILVFPILLSGITYSQISQPVRLTNGNNDKNASFGIINSMHGFGFADYEFMIFESHSGTHSQICVSKINSEGSIDSATYLTNDTYSNINPAIEYNRPDYPDYNLQTAFAVWQSDKFGRQSLFGAAYNVSTGWTQPFIIDSSNTDNKKPVLEKIDSLNYMIVYEIGEDIKYKLFNIVTHETSAEGILTSQVTEVCSNPTVVGNSSSVTITYDKEFSEDHKAIYFRTGSPNSIPATENPNDTVIYSGKNHCLGFGNWSLRTYPIFETDRNGKTEIYAAQLTSPFNLLHVVSDSANDVLNYKGADIFITDGNSNKIYSYLSRSSTDLRFDFNGLWSSINLKISNDPFYTSSISMGNGARVPDVPCQRTWFVFNKDSSDAEYPSTIYGISFTNCVTKINQSNNSQPEKFYLSQNYPNPFNPNTKITFDLKVSEFTELKVYDMLGNEVATLVNETKPAGRYSVEWNASNFPSGIYFYKLTTGNFSEVKRMTLLK